MTEAAQAQTLGFQTEAKRLLHLMIHSMYSNRDIFLRELISNASDAADRLRFAALENAALLAGDPELRVRIDIDPEAHLITITDNGIGMSREEAIANLGTIARSGTAEFLDALSGDRKPDARLIGQFGIGFYSGFLVADRILVESRRADLPAEQGVRWSCSGEAEFTVETIARAARGTSVILHLKEDAREYESDWRLRSLVKKYSDHIAIPVEMRAPPQGDGGAGPDAGGQTPAYERVNSATALWTRPRGELGDDEYKAFYQHISHDFREPLAWAHNRVEGKLDYTSLIYIPAHAPFDLYNRDTPRGLKLYIQRTFIMDDAEQFLPLYLRFVKGVVDCADLPLNVSRELLQRTPAVDSIRGALTKRVLELLETLARERPEDYRGFWGEFGTVLKEGLAEDPAHRERIAGLLRFASTRSEDGLIGLADYVTAMQPGQRKIYYLIADTERSARHSPYLEVFRQRGVEVLLLAERIDEWAMSQLRAFDGRELCDISRGELDLDGLPADSGGAAAAPAEGAGTDCGAALDRLRELLGDRVAEVRVSARLTESPACLVLAQHALGPQLRRILEASGQQVPEAKPVLEVNPTHPLVARVGTESDAGRREDLAQLLYDQAALAAGETLADPAGFVRRLNRLLSAG
ncbi:MAG: molecular chaperone HtpG [Pseudomonadota bacterium]|jgi:molecular chaperone HtpG